MDQDIDELIEVSRFFGNDKEYVIAGGGNTSYKDDEFLWIKASGTSLASITKGGLVKLSRHKLSVISEKTYNNDSVKREEEVKNDLINAVVSTGSKRPSVETSLHNLVDYPFVVHTHPTVVNALLCSGKAGDMSAQIFGKEVLFIEYTDPGYVLFKKVSEQIDAYRSEYGMDPRVILLENHGIIVGGNDQEEIKTIYSEIEKDIRAYFNEELPSSACSHFHTELASNIIAAYPDSDELVFKSISCELAGFFVRDRQTFSMVDTAFTPDHIVYCKAKYFFLGEADRPEAEVKLKMFQQQNGYLPKVIGLEDQGLFIAEENDASAEVVKELILNMMKIAFYARALGNPKPMTHEQIAFIENWEAENYRKKMTR
jgi:rhamnose utilization protein RhaD (predicted bifunctional aldolase and dehydrogenase)